MSGPKTVAAINAVDRPRRHAGVERAARRLRDRALRPRRRWQSHGMPPAEPRPASSSRSPAAATRSRRSIMPASPTTSPMFRPPAVPFWNGWKARHCPASKVLEGRSAGSQGNGGNWHDARQSAKTLRAAMTAPGKGILAADESSGTIKKRFDSIGLASTEDSAPRLSRDAVPRRGCDAQLHLGRHPLRRDASPEGRRRDAAGRAHRAPPAQCPASRWTQAPSRWRCSPGETITEGLDGLREQLKEYYGLGARFAKWRAVIAIADGLPTANGGSSRTPMRSPAMPRSARRAGMVPIVEPEVLMDGDPGTHRPLLRRGDRMGAGARCSTSSIAARVALEGMVLKPNMVIAGKQRPHRRRPRRWPRRRCACSSAPSPPPCPASPSCPAASRTSRRRPIFADERRWRDLPWKLTFSYGRALQAAA